MNLLLTKKLGIQYNAFEKIDNALLRLVKQIYFQDIYSVKIVAQNYIIVLQEVIQKTNIFIDVQNIKILLLNHVQVILLENIS